MATWDTKITILVDNEARAGLQPEFGLSLWVENRGTRFLFDTGQERGALLENAAQLGIDPGAADYVILSHGHYDHCGGLSELLVRGCRSARPLSFFRGAAQVQHPQPGSQADPDAARRHGRARPSPPGAGALGAAARQLGLHESQLYSWRSKAGLSQDKSAAEEQLLVENARLKRQLAERNEELAIIKKAAAYFVALEKGCFYLAACVKASSA